MKISPLSPAKPTKVYEYYWRLAADRQKIFFNRIRGITPLTFDPILLKYKFTNTYRASDRVSQYLIKNVIYNGSQTVEDIFFRIILFKTFNKIKTWQLLENEMGEIRYSLYSFERYNKLLSDCMRKGEAVYSAAYIMSSGNSVFGYARKHSNHLKIIEKMMADNLPSKIKKSKSMQAVFELLRSYPTIGNFLAYQYAIDINYSTLTDFSEMDFVVPGPGALDGIKKCFVSLGGLNEVEIIKLVTEKQSEEFERFGIEFKNLWGRPMQLIDCQNVFCEISKYSRVKFPQNGGRGGRKRIKQSYRPNLEKIMYWYPPKWKINEKVEKELSRFQFDVVERKGVK